MTQLTSIQAVQPSNRDYHNFDQDRQMVAVAKKRLQNNWTCLQQDESESFMFTTDLDLAIDELSTSWGI